MIVRSYGEKLARLEPEPTGPTPGDISFADKQFGAPHFRPRGQSVDITATNNSAPLIPDPRHVRTAGQMRSLPEPAG